MLTDLGRARSVVQLVSKHSGEIVEFDHTKMGWMLHRLVPPGSASGPSVEWNQQWNCKEDGSPTFDAPKDTEYGYTRVPDSITKMSEDIQRVLNSSYHELIAIQDEVDPLLPHWEAQRLRTVVPCVGTQAYEWRRTGQVVTLGTLFMALGKRYSAAAIYYFYRTLRIVATKKPKNTSRKAAAPGYASAHVGRPVGTTGTSCHRRAGTTCVSVAKTVGKHQSLTVLLCAFCTCTLLWPPRMDYPRLCA